MCQIKSLFWSDYFLYLEKLSKYELSCHKVCKLLRVQLYISSNIDYILKMKFYMHE